MRLSTLCTIVTVIVATAIGVWHAATHHSHPLPAMGEFLSIYCAALRKMAVLGIVSLCIGMSFVTVALFIYWLSIRTPRRRRQRPRRTRRAA